MSKKILIGLAVAFLVFGFFYFQAIGNQEKNTNEKETKNTEETNLLSLIDIEDSPSMGNPDAPVTMINYSSYYCPFCLKFKAETFPAIKEEYIDTGKLFYVYKDSGSPEDPIILATHCAGNQGFFWEYQSLLQERGVMEERDLYLFAEELNLDEETFSSCLTEECCSDKIEKAFQEMEVLGAQSIPFFVINNEKVSGLIDFDDFKKIIDREIQKNEE